MSERTINIVAGMASVGLVLLYAWYNAFGAPRGITFAFLPLLSIAMTFGFLAVHQFLVARDNEPNHPFTYPVSFRWVLAINYTAFTILLWWVIVEYFHGPMPYEPHLRRSVWLVAALTHIWFLRRFLVWDQRNLETKDERDKRQEATDVRQHKRDIVQDKRERDLSGVELDDV